MEEQLSENLELQLAELELLQSMFPSDAELKLDDPLVVDEINVWLQDTHSPLPLLPSYCLTLTIVDDKQLTLHVNYLQTYPFEPVKGCRLFVNSNSLEREQQGRLNGDLVKHLKQTLTQPNMLAISEAVSWLQENAERYYVTKQKVQQSSSSTKKNEESFTRLWLYSHHIYSKTKRKDILDLAKDNKLTGFCMPGKPGIVCLEGPTSACNSVWSDIKSWTWKKINVKWQEEFAKEDDNSFDAFEEIGFVKAETRDYHMDMGEFHKFLVAHNCGHMFKELFGIEKT